MTTLTGLATEALNLATVATPERFSTAKILGVVGSILAIVIGIGALTISAKHRDGNVSKAAKAASVHGISIFVFTLAGILLAISAYFAGWLTFLTTGSD